MDNSLKSFLTSFAESLRGGAFIKMTLGHYKGDDNYLKKIVVRPVAIRGLEKLAFTYQYKAKDIAKNYGIEEGTALIEKYLEGDFFAAHLFTVQNDYTLDLSLKGAKALKTLPASQKKPPSLSHDAVKNHMIDTARPYLHTLGLADADGKILPSAQDKFRQINRYIELLSPHIKKIACTDMRILDMGAGKGYLTFALYDYLKHILEIEANVTGVEMRPDLVNLCNDIAGQNQFSGLRFAEGTIAGYAGDCDMLIALHACDTATDDAIAAGVKGGATLIVVAPCCHKQIRREMEKGSMPPDFSFALRHGIFMERQAEMVTDSLRALVLEYFGYSVKVMEFISDAHTPKNIMILAEKTGVKKPETLKKIAAAKGFFGIETFALDTLLKS